MMTSRRLPDPHGHRHPRRPSSDNENDDDDDNDDDNVLVFQDVLAKYMKKKNACYEELLLDQRGMSSRSNTSRGSGGAAEANSDANLENNDSNNEDDNDDHDISLAFFELANASVIGYRIPHSFYNNNSDNIRHAKKNDSRRRLVRIRQDSKAATHTGGVVWETSFLLLEFLLAQYFVPRDASSSQTSSSSSPSLSLPHTTTRNAPSTTLGRVIEVGAGCGLLGIALAAAAALQDDVNCPNRKRTLPIVTSVTVTETAEVLVNLQANVQANQPLLELPILQHQQQEEEEGDDFPSKSSSRDQPKDDSKKKRKKRRKSSDSRRHRGQQQDLLPMTTTIPLHCRVLDWTCFEQDDFPAATATDGVASSSSSSTTSSSSNRSLLKGAADTIVGTDVIFTPTLVEPLLATLQYLSHDETVVYLCVQVRCATSHALFLNKTAFYNFDVTEVDSPQEWGKELECHIYQMRRVKT